jgi:hypothetical protein
VRNLDRTADIRHAVHAAAAADPRATTREIAETVGLATAEASIALRACEGLGLVRGFARAAGSLPMRWESTAAPLARRPGLGARLIGLIDLAGLGGSVEFRKVAGVSMRRASCLHLLDLPNTTNAVMTRRVAADAARRIAARLRTRADALDAWAVEAVS